EASTASPFGDPVTATVRRDLPSALICVTQPRSPPSTTSQFPSGKATGPSGKHKAAEKISLTSTSPVFHQTSVASQTATKSSSLASEGYFWGRSPSAAWALLNAFSGFWPFLWES